jgi:hypothetical protein
MMRPDNKEDCIKPEEQTDFRSGVGMLNYLLKHPRPELSNCVRELAKLMDGVTKAHTKSLMRVIKFVLDTKERGSILKPNFKNIKWVLEPYCDK